MQIIIAAIKALLIGFTLAANAFYLLSILAARRFFSGRRESGVQTPPVSIMIPMRGADFKAYQNYAAFCRQDYPQYQIVFGVRESTDSSIAIVEKLVADFPDSDIDLVICPEVIGANLKVSNLQNMYARVKHDHIVIVDSDIRAGADYLRRVIAEFSDAGVGLVTCLYRAAEAPDFAAELEAVGITAEFAPGVLMAWMIEGVKFALGSTMATTRERLEAVGGFHALKDYLADDFMLGKLIAEQGYEIRISHYLVETAMSPAGFSSMMRHQMRWARSTRISRPLGYLGLVLTYGTALALINMLVSGGSATSVLLLAFTLAVRMAMGWAVGVHYLEDRILKKRFFLLPARDVLSFVIWCLSWAGKRVEWRGKLFEVLKDGRIVEVGEKRPPAELIGKAGT
ncbi:MAG TPA: bacteriohopanetetrol glucosamine biosynthesis glycosyltransferase HpnI [Blastocatellia bacterium]|jgi:ceramide glucosyltransferase